MEGILSIPFFIALGLFYIALIALIITLIQAILNLRRLEPKNIKTYLIVTSILFIPGWCSWYFQSSLTMIVALAILIVTFLIYKNKFSVVLALLGLFPLIVKAMLSGNAIALGNHELTLLPIVFNKMSLIGDTSWFYLSLNISGVILLGFSLYYYFSKNILTKMPFYLALLLALIIIPAGAIRDTLVYNKNITRSKIVSVRTTNVEKITFLRNNDLWLSDTSGSASPMQISKVNNELTVISSLVSKDEKYVVYIVGQPQGKGTEMDVYNISTKETKKIFVSNGSDTINSGLTISNNNLLAFVYQSEKEDLTANTGKTVRFMKVYSIDGQELYSWGNAQTFMWNGTDLIMLKPGNVKTEVYISKGGTTTPQKIGDINHDGLQGGQVYYLKEPNELIYSNIINSQGLDYMDLKYFSFNLNTKQATEIKLSGQISPATLFSQDFKYYLVDDKAHTMVIKAVDGTENIEITQIFSYSHRWYGDQLLTTTGQGIMAAGINGEITKITDNPNDKI